MSKELSFTLEVKVNSDGVEHELDVITSGYNKVTTQDIRDIINEDIDYLVEDVRRRIWKL